MLLIFQQIVLRLCYNSMRTQRFLFLFFLFSLSCSQKCCGLPSACPAEAACLCQGNVDSCIYEIVEQSRSFNIRNQSNYFNWVPNTDQYLSVTISLCSQNNEGDGGYLAGLVIQKSDGSGYPQNPNISFTLQGNCYQTLISKPVFCTAPSGGYCNIILSLTPTGGSFPRKVSIVVEYVQGIAQYITIILIVLGCVMLLVIIILVSCMIKKRMRGEMAEVQENLGDLTHFKAYIPKVKLKQLIEARVVGNEQYNCCVCLTEVKLEDKVRRTYCGHIFHVDCIDLWCIKNMSCPMCREKLDQKSLKRRRDESELMPIVVRQLSNVKIQMNGDSSDSALNLARQL